MIQGTILLKKNINSNTLALVIRLSTQDRHWPEYDQVHLFATGRMKSILNSYAPVGQTAQFGVKVIVQFCQEWEWCEQHITSYQPCGFDFESLGLAWKDEE